MENKLTYDQALDVIDAGKFVRLPEWVGYWFNDGTGPKAFTRTGDVVDAWIGMMYVITRTDWEICDGSLGFDFSVLALKAGKKIRRACWAKDTFIQMEGEVIMASTKQGAVTWVPTQEDILATDYELYV